MTSEPEPRDQLPWRILDPDDLWSWAFDAATATADAVAVLEFIRDEVLSSPDFGESIDAHTRGAIAPGSEIEVIWSFNPAKRHVEIITPFAPSS